VKTCLEGNLKAIMLYKQFTDLQVLSQAAKARRKARNMKLVQDLRVSKEYEPGGARDK
jgi:hypothetical protein